MALYLGRQKIAPVVNTVDVALADATESDVKKGKTFFSGDTEIKTGTFEIKLQEKTATENGEVVADVGFDGLSKVTVNVPVPDLSATTATAEDVLQGKKFYNAEGEFVDGSYNDMLQRLIDDKKSCKNLFERYPEASIPYLNKLDTSNVTTMQSMFYNCKNLTSLDLSNFNTKNVTDMSYMFWSCKKLTSLDLSNFDTSKVTTFYQLFYECYNLSEVNLSGWDTSNVTDMYRAFSKCDFTSLDLSSFNVSSLRGLDQTFFDTQSLEVIDLSGWETSNFTTYAYAFNACVRLKTIFGVLDMVNVSSSYGTDKTFQSCQNLETVTLKNIKFKIQLGSGTSYGTKLTNETLINTAQELWDNTNNALGGSRTLTLSTTSKTNIANIYVKLIPVTDEMRAEDEYIDNKKPCVVCESTDEGAMTLTEYIISKGWAIA